MHCAERRRGSKLDGIAPAAPGNVYYYRGVRYLRLEPSEYLVRERRKGGVLAVHVASVMLLCARECKAWLCTPQGGSRMSGVDRYRLDRRLSTQSADGLNWILTETTQQLGGRQAAYTPLTPPQPTRLKAF